MSANLDRHQADIVAMINRQPRPDDYEITSAARSCDAELAALARERMVSPNDILDFLNRYRVLLTVRYSPGSGRHLAEIEPFWLPQRYMPRVRDGIVKLYIASIPGEEYLISDVLWSLQMLLKEGIDRSHLSTMSGIAAYILYFDADHYPLLAAHVTLMGDLV